MRPTIYVAAFLVASAPAAAQSPTTKRDTAPPSPGTVCAEREGRCDTGAVKGEKCRGEGEMPCADPPPVKTACIDRDRDGTCDTHPRNKRAGFLAALGGAITSLWVNNVPEDKGGGGARDNGASPQGPNVP